MAIGAHAFLLYPPAEKWYNEKMQGRFPLWQYSGGTIEAEGRTLIRFSSWRNAASVRGFAPGRNPFHWEGIAWPNAATMKFKKVCEN
jgi:hypothetical protein